jgi:hypothetical protein
MENQQTCGMGLAEHSAVPAKLADLIASLAENLEVHKKALDLRDESSRKEHDAYLGLAKEHREIANRLRSTAGRMAGYRDLPMGRHDEKAMRDPKVLEAFENFVTLEQELLALLRKRVEQDRKMLSGVGGSGGEATRVGAS